MPSVSILVPSYGHAAFLAECLDSVLAQTFTDWELILIDDCGPDDSLEIARGYAARDPRIQAHANEGNLGTYGTQQRALEMAQSPWIAVLNSDDVWQPRKLQDQMDALRLRPEATACAVLGTAWDGSGEQDVHADWPRTLDFQPFPWLLYENRLLASGMVFRREGLRFETTCRYSGDWMAILGAVRRGDLILVEEPLVRWRQHETNSYRISPNQVAEEIRVRRSIQAATWAGDGAREGCARNLMNLAALWSLTDQPARAREAIREARSLLPDSVTIRRRNLLLGLPNPVARRRLWPRLPRGIRRSAWREAGPTGAEAPLLHFHP
ncbi:MAG: glycosyltransferase [Fimbriimonadaceae bacterium]|nr:glycosyltransferase [Fimbriimonadaceae bacterium]